MIEKEYKRLLTQKEYESLCEKFSFDNSFTQINFYYREKSKNNLNTTIRVRLKEEKMHLQVKELIFKEKGVHIKKEFEKELTVLPYIIEGSLLNELCRSNQYQDSVLMGLLITERKDVNIKGCQISLDANHYCGITDYEVEIEYQKEIDSDIMTIIREENIYKEENTKGKYERYIERYFERRE